MKIWISPYELFPLASLNRFQQKTRKGFLLKIQTSSLEAGYADCHPLVEFGDDTVEALLKKVRSQKKSSLFERSIALAKIDGRAREEKRSLFSKTPIKSHYTCSDIRKLSTKSVEQWMERGFTTVKLKVGKNPKAESLHLQSQHSRSLPIRFRFDANSGTGDQFLSGLDDDYLEKTEFIEDPLPFDLKKWSALSKAFSVACAFDAPKRAKTDQVYKGIRIIKPVRQSLTPKKSDVITNSMDHPVGQSFAFLAAQKAVDKWGKQPKDFGLITAHLFKSNPFFKEIATSSPYFKASEGYGIGFNQLLEGQKWISL